MSIIATHAKVATISTGTRKAFNAVPVNNLIHGIIFREGVLPESSIRPSDVRMSSSAAIAAMGGKMSPQSFILGLVFTATRYAHGNVVDATTLPEGSKTAINAALSLIKKGAGITALSLETATRAGIQALLALPAPAKKAATVTIATDATVTPAIATTMNLQTLKAGIVARSSSTPNDYDSDGYANPHHASAQDWHSSWLAARDFLRAEVAKQEEAKAAEFEMDAAASAKTLVATITSRRDAEDIVRKLAASLGFKLVRVPAKKAA